MCRFMDYCGRVDHERADTVLEDHVLHQLAGTCTRHLYDTISSHLSMDFTTITLT